MRIALVTQEEPFYLPPALNTLCEACSEDVVALVILPAFDESLPETAGRLYEFYGPVNFVRLGWRFLVAKVVDQINHLKSFTRPYSAGDVARRHNVPTYRPMDINAPEFVAVLEKQIRPDLLVSVAASQVLKPRVLETPPLGCINLHSAPLPRYQGMMPNFWVLLHRESEGTVTVHYMTEELDTGNVILQRPVPIFPHDSLHDLMVRSKRVGVQALMEAIEQIGKGTVRACPMDVGKATYFSFPTRADAQRLRAQGRRLL
jgi:methionyl-tRNA formyltransferase